MVFWSGVFSGMGLSCLFFDVNLPAALILFILSVALLLAGYQHRRLNGERTKRITPGPD